MKGLELSPYLLSIYCVVDTMDSDVVLLSWQSGREVRWQAGDWVYGDDTEGHLGR